MKNIINTQNIEQPIYSKQIIHFFSVKDGVGKTTTSLNTAIELAKNTGKKICIIDLNTTNANIHSHLGLFDATNDLSTGITSTTNNNYTATRTATTEDTTFMGMNSTAWTWLILGISAIAIISLVWYYSAQFTSSNYSDRD